MLKIRSFNQLDDYLEYDDFKGLVPKKMRLPRIDVIRDSLKCFCLKSLQAMHSAIIINKTTHYFHRFVVATFVGKDPHIIIGFKMLNPKQDSSKKIRFAHDLKA